MNKDNAIALEKPTKEIDLLTDLLRSGARELITKAVQRNLPPEN